MPENAKVDTISDRLLDAHAVPVFALSAKQFQIYFPCAMLETVNDASLTSLTVLPVCAQEPDMFVYNVIEELSETEQVKIIVVWLLVFASFGSFNVTVGAASASGIRTKSHNAPHFFFISFW